MSHDPLEIIWRSADHPEPIFTAEELTALPAQGADRLTETGVLRPTLAATHVACDACGDHHVERVVPIRYPDRRVRFYIPCPDNTRVEVPGERLRQWAVDYSPLLTALASGLSAQGAMVEVVPGRVWNLGRASLSGRSKPLWAARGLAWPDAGRVAAAIPRGRSPVLFFLGQPADHGLLAIPDESVIELRTVMQLNGSLAADRGAVEGQLAEPLTPAQAKPPRKQGHRDAVVGALKRELHQRIVALRSALRHAEDAGRPFPLPRTTQKELAAAIGASAPSVSRAIAESGDRELAIMLQTIEQEDLIRHYAR